MGGDAREQRLLDEPVVARFAENEIDHVLVGNVSAHLAIQPNLAEVHAYRWITIEKLHKELAAHPEIFTPWFKQAFLIAI